MRTARGRALLLTVFVLAACTRARETTTPDSAPSPTPTVTQEDLEEIEDTIRDYFEAFRNDDYDGRKLNSSGELQALAEWQRLLSQGGGGSERTTFELEKLDIETIESDLATVELEATMVTRFRDVLGGRSKYTLHFDGPAMVKKVEGKWRLVDYQRNGRSQEEELFTKVRGRQDRNGIAIRVIGADLRSNATLVVVEIRNTTTDRLDLGFQAQIVGKGGRQLSEGGPTVSKVAPKARLRTVYFWDEQSLPLSTKKFRLLLEVFSDEFFETTEFDFSVTLLG